MAKGIIVNSVLVCYDDSRCEYENDDSIKSCNECHYYQDLLGK